MATGAKKSKWTVDIEPAKSWKDIYPFHAAAQGGDLESLKLEFEREKVERKNFLNRLDDDGWSPLHYSSWYGHLSVVEQLLQWGADPNVKNQSNSTPLHFAAGCGQKQVVQVLLKHGADKNLMDNEKNDPKGLAKQLQPEGFEEIVSILN